MPETARVIIASEEPQVGRILEHKLRREGYDVQLVRGALELHEALDGAVDVLIAPAALVTAASVTPPVGWLAIVDSRDAAMQHASMAAGAAGLVRTPFKPTGVAAQVATLLALVRL